MFRDFGVEITGFDACPEAERSVSDGCCQTIDLKTFSQATQTMGSSSSETQATPDTGVNSQPYDADRLLKFLHRVLPHLEKELMNSDNSEDDLNFNNISCEAVGGQEKSLEVSVIQAAMQPHFCKEKMISDLSWNSTGMLLAVASSEKSHEGWCCHESCVGIYNLGKSQFEKNPPMQLLKVPACVKCIGFHPFIPSLLAGGLHSGEVVIWDLTNEEALVCDKKGFGDEGVHFDAITSLTWRENRNVARSAEMVTTGRDGKVIFWKVIHASLNYEPSHRFLILKHHLTTAAATKEHLEVLHAGFWPHRESEFVVATGDGSIFHCSLATAKDLLGFPGYKDPVRMSYKPHEGIVTCVSCAATCDIFASCGTDSEIHLYKAEASTPLFVIHTKYPTVGVAWTMGSKYLVSWGCSSKIECRKMGEYDATTVCEVDGGVSAVAINSKRQGRTAVGSQAGEVLILCEDAN